ncbi:MAG: sulfatase-like hydrolase/transferase, partial [Proteobacteria bacterium]|nr:sulfatase-like hydrolase/transferase [Pseudomonadota bacterium]
MLGCYGHPEIHTPNIDRIAERGTLFDRAYCQYPLCSPSRTSMITGLRPETTNVLNNSADFRQKLPDVVTLPQHFKEHGYHTQSVGRVFHLPTLQDDQNSWSAPSWRPAWIPFNKQTTPSWQALDVGDDELRDGKTAKRAVQVLEQIKESQFFLTVGFYKPHLPLKAPRKYFDLYNTQTFNLPASSTPPKDVPARALTNWSAIRDFQDLPSGTEPLSDGKTLELIRAYAAAASYVDAQIGRVLNQLDTLGLTENTVVVFCGDHGHHLGEHGIWGKQTLFEVSLRSPLIFSVPGQIHPKAKTNALAELVDIYPTLCGACQIPIPPQLEGTSLMPVIEQPTRPWKTAAFSRDGGAANGGNSIRTKQYRYTEWGLNGSRGVELYDYDADPDETVNIASHSENAELVTHLSERLHAGWQAALPDVQARIPIPQTLPWDINNDGVVDIQDLILVSSHFGLETPGHPKVDVNKDGGVDIIDLLLVATHFGESNNPAAPSKPMPIPAEHAALVDEWLAEARLADNGSDIFRQGIATLEHLIHTT